MLLARLPPLLAAEAIESQIAVVAQSALVAGLTPAAAQLEVVDPGDVLHELLVRDAPGGGERGEVAPAMAGCQSGAAISTQVGGHHVGVVPVVLQTAEEGENGPVGSRGARAAPADLVGSIQGAEEVIGIVTRVDVVLAPLALGP